ncbi:regulatory protein, luxR family [Jatrophihabitans endophyticus]|uniref:Regulatory protein, luxR family n=1 Tax=Jatrophihabitans endophyticus TaxID=1206085 RepID=A0A1M5HHV7_9ACTN|nr:helix-turn-helix transcriptional regulator [Jatrophihabitans endophyticus]SHG15468.1 regulatory protein, luxR family [Jatrophihabitans endophyticus]
MGEFGELTESDVALYRAVLEEPGRGVPDIAASLAVTSDDIDKSVARLVELGLLRHGDGDRLTGVSPMLAEATVLGAEDLELGARRAAVEQRRDTIRRLVPQWNSAFTSAVHEGVVDVISDQSAIANILMHYADRCEHELLSVAPGRLPATRMDGRTRVANVYSARRGIKTRALYQHTALRDRATRSYLNELAQNGATIRFAPSVPGRSLVVDRSVALLPIPTDDPGRHGLAVVRERNVIAWVVATFEQLWSEASPLEDVINRQHDDTELDQTRAAILRLMAEGEKDEAISRRLAISVRTCRRHIADYMAQVGATSRFQAGVIAARAGHTDSPTQS